MAAHHLHQFLLKQLYQVQVSGQNQSKDTYKKKKGHNKKLLSAATAALSHDTQRSCKLMRIE